MNYWTSLSADYAKQRNYLDELYRVYPIVPNIRREMSTGLWEKIERAYHERNNIELVKSLLKTELFPIKDSYIAYLRKDLIAIERNPDTVNRIAGCLIQMGLDKIYEKCTEPKETNRQIGPMFKRWISQGTLGCSICTNAEEFLSLDSNAVLNMSDSAMKAFAKYYLGYNRDKGLDLIARFNNKYIIAETKFLTDFGGHQNAQFFDAIATLNSELTIPNRLDAEVIKIAIFDGVLYIPGRNKFYQYLTNNPNDTIISSLLLREYLYAL